MLKDSYSWSIWWNYLFIVFLFVLLTVFLFIKVGETVIIWDIFPYESKSLELVFQFDWISILFLIMVSYVSVSVFIYSNFYMKAEKFKKGFSILLAMFVGSMVLLSISGSLFLAILGWDGLGITSFGLIIYFQNWKAMNSGIVTFLSNRLGDVTIILSIAILSTWEACLSNGVVIVIALFLLFSSLTKSAQLPFSAWLPLAMAAPTPVSALVHSSTLVTAGLFLLIRFGSIFPDWVKVVGLLISCVTALLSSSSALMEFDLKKIIALSTLSHVSLMFIFTFLGSAEAAMVHMFVHALFKSALFMSSGEIIHKGLNFQDIRKLEFFTCSVWVKMVTIVSILSMAGSPFLAGFYSKELLLEHSLVSIVSFLCFTVSAGLTCGYSFRLLFYLSKIPSKVSLDWQNKSILDFPMIWLTLVSSILGSIGLEFLVPSAFLTVLSSESKVSLLVAVMFGIGIGLFLVLFPQMLEVFQIGVFLVNMWWVSSLNWAWTPSLLQSSRLLFSSDGKGILDKSKVLTKKEIGKVNFTKKSLTFTPLLAVKIFILSGILLQIFAFLLEPYIPG